MNYTLFKIMVFAWVIMAAITGNSFALHETSEKKREERPIVELVKAVGSILLSVIFDILTYRHFITAQPALESLYKEPKLKNLQASGPLLGFEMAGSLGSL